ncbi:phosphoribosylformimino-5-aminoimidazole carboxamide ribotide isomerase [Verrucomicrobiota bacterium]
MRFRPCIDLHNGKVKQIVGSSLVDGEEPETNFVAEQEPAWFAELYKNSGLTGGHVIKLGPNNDQAARAALAAYPGGLQVGGGITAENAREWLDAGASQVIVTSYVFRDGQVDWDRLEALADVTGRDRLVLDLSCRMRAGQYYIVTDRWQKFTDVAVNAETMQKLAAYSCEFLVHAVDVEGKQQGIDEDLIRLLAADSPVPVTYAGGVHCMDDLARIKTAGVDRIDVTVGSALDIFGGQLAYSDVVAFCD